MADVQLKNGYTRIANNLLIALARTELKSSEFMIALAVISKTYGYNKKEDKISLSQFEEMTLMHRSSCARAIRGLVSKGILASVRSDTRVKGTSNSTTMYWIQKDYDKWIVNTPSVPLDTSPSLRPTHDPSVPLDTSPSLRPIIITKDNKHKTQDIPAQAALAAKTAGPAKVKHLTFVLLLPVEFEKLQQRFGEEDTQKYIYRLNNYIGSTGKRYKSHYHTILNWADMDSRKQ